MAKVFDGQDTLVTFLLVLLLISSFTHMLSSVEATTNPVENSDWSTKMVWEEEFETYAVGTFPSPPWSLWASGNGTEQQRITDAISAFGTKSLRMFGKYYYGAIAARPVTITAGTKIGFEVMIFVENNGTAPEVSGGASVAFASDSPSPALWRHWGRIIFRSDLRIVADSQELGNYSTKRWYKIKEVFDVSAKTFQVWIDDELRSQSLTEYNPDPIIGADALALVSDYAQQVCYFDSVKVFKMINLRVLQQNFDEETVGQVPAGWSIVAPEYGIISVDNLTYYGELGKSGKIMDTSTLGSPCPYRNFPEQTGVIVVAFAIKLAKSEENEGGLEVRIDDGDFSGANTIFNQDGTIQYRNDDGQNVLLHRSSFVYAWHKVKIIMNIPKNVYNIHVDDHLDAVNVNFTGTCKQIHRIIINFTSPKMRSAANIDDLQVVRCLVIPEDFPTIQQGVYAASHGDVIWVRERTYFENITVQGKSIWLIGENASTTVIDGKFGYTNERKSDVISIRGNNVTIYGFTVRNAEHDGIYVNGSDNTVTNSIISSALGDGIRIAGSRNTLISNTFDSNNGCGIRITSGEDNLVKNNIIKDNAQGLRCESSTKDNKIYQNRVVSNIIQAEDFGFNIWDDGYPFLAAQQKGGGNYWSHFFSVDMYSGANQDEHGPCCTPRPDGICDSPIRVPPNSQDNYPLFLIQNVTQQPPADNVTYKDNVNVTTTILENVQIEEAEIYINKTYANNTSMQVEIPIANLTRIEHNEAGRPTYQYILEGTIPKEPWSTQIKYNISARAYTAPWLSTATETGVSPWLNTTDYPLPDQHYHVIDPYPPIVSNSQFSILNSSTIVPPSPNENQTISVYVNVTEDINASGVDRVLLEYNVDSSTWKTEMIEVRNFTTNVNITREYKGVMPKQPAGTLNFTITAYDKAGNAAQNRNGTAVKLLAKLVLRYNGVVQGDPCNIDFGVISKNTSRSDSLLTIFNSGQEFLQWNMTLVKTLPRDGSAWLSFTPASSITDPLSSTNITITVNTGLCPNPGLYSAELSVRANGSTPQWAIVVSVWVGQIIIDKSWASITPPNRCNINDVQTVAYHAIWAHNASDATSGQITVDNKSNSTNATGWAMFSVTSGIVIENKTFPVQAVNFTFDYGTARYFITSFRQDAPNATITWDRVNIILSRAIDHSRVDVGANASEGISSESRHSMRGKYISWIGSVYESDDTTFEGYPVFKEGYPDINDSRLVRDEVGEEIISVFSIVDLKYGLTAFISNNLTLIFDQVKIIAGGAIDQSGVPTLQVGTGQPATVWFVAIYEYDNTLFKGNWDTQQPCSLYVNISTTIDRSINTIIDDPLVWSSEKERWEKSYSFSTGGTRSIRISRVNDTKYGLTKIKDSVRPLNLTWGPVLWMPFITPTTQSDLSPETQAVPSQFMQQALIWIAVLMVLAVVATTSFLLLMKKGTLHVKGLSLRIVSQGKSGKRTS